VELYRPSKSSTQTEGGLGYPELEETRPVSDRSQHSKAAKDKDVTAKQAALEEAKALKAQVLKLEGQLVEIEDQLYDLASSVPNDTHPTSLLVQRTSQSLSRLTVLLLYRSILRGTMLPLEKLRSVRLRGWIPSDGILMVLPHQRGRTPRDSLDELRLIDRSEAWVLSVITPT